MIDRLSWPLAASIAFLVLGAAPAAAQPLFADDSLVSLTLTGPLKTIARERKNEKRDYHSGTLSYVGRDGTPVELDVDLRSRGNFRRVECRQPPLRLRFRKDQVKGTLFERQRRLKLVRPCEAGAKFEQFVVEEYLLYQVYGLLTEYSFRARSLRAKFVESGGKGRQRTSFAFLIEDQDRMAKRLDRVVAEWSGADYEQLNAEHAALVELFMYMIGAHDWSVLAAPEGSICCHNARLLIATGATSEAVAVPYDFDFAGIINAPYASPPSQIPIRKVTQRHFRGRCKSPELWASTFARFQANHEAIYAVYRDSVDLHNRSRNKATKYLNQFYAIIDDPARREESIVARCR